MKINLIAILILTSLLFFSCNNYENLPKSKQINIIINEGLFKLFNFSLTQSDLNPLNEKELIILMNTPVAKYGKIFKTKWIFDHFSKYNWYKPTYENIDNFLTTIEKDNIQLISKYLNLNKIYSKSSDIINQLSINSLRILENSNCPILPHHLDLIFEFELNNKIHLGAPIIGPIDPYSVKGGWELRDDKIVISYELKECERILKEEIVTTGNCKKPQFVGPLTIKEIHVNNSIENESFDKMVKILFDNNQHCILYH